MSGSLTPEQQAAVSCDAHALEIRAGAGTGKTFTLAHRVARFAPTPQAQQRLLVVTFTREATASLQRRLSLLLGRDHLVRVHSFHQWAARELPRDARVFMPEAETRRALSEALARVAQNRGFARALGVAPGSGDDVAGRVQAFLSYLKNAETTMGRALVSTHVGLAPWEDVLQHAQDVYESRKGDRLDYDDLLLTFRHRLKSSPAFRKGVASRLDHLFVDEYQDVNGIQAETVRLLTLPEGSPRVSVVGDLRQSIYGFRGGSPDHLAGFLKPYGARGERRALTVSFRSDRALVEAGNSVLSDLHPLRPRPRAPEGVRPEVRACDDAADEARFVADRVEALLAADVDPAEVVVLARARHLAAAWQEEVASRRGDDAWLDRNPAFLLETIDRFVEGPRMGLAQFALLEGLPGPLARTARVLARRARAARLGDEPTAAHLLALPKAEGVAQVAFATIHAAKGLEWDHVLLLGAREGGLPSEHALNAPTETQARLLEEERRLLYVALTRARRTFVATWPQRSERREHAMARFLEPLVAQRAPAVVVPVAPKPRAKKGRATTKTRA